MEKKSSVSGNISKSQEILLCNMDNIHTTPMGADRIRKNLNLNTEDVVSWCKQKISSQDCLLVRRGKNWYAQTVDCIITVNAHSYTIITAHREKKKCKLQEETNQ